MAGTRAPDERADGAAPAGATASPLDVEEPRGYRVGIVAFAARAYLGVAAVLFTVNAVVFHLFEHNPEALPKAEGFPGSWLLGGWTWWDANWYQMIANDGYWYVEGQQSPVAFFPAYPMAMRALHAVGLDLRVAGSLLTFVCGLGAVLLFASWARDRIGERAARTAVLMLVLWPYAWYLFGAVYADALYICATIAAFWLLERDRPVLAGLAGMVATAARPVGVAVLVGLVVLVVVRRGGLRRLMVRDAGVLLSGLGLALWMAYLGASFGDPVAFSSTQSSPGWDQPSGPKTWFKILFLQHVKRIPEYVALLWPDGDGSPVEGVRLQYTLGLVIQGALVLTALVLVPLIVKRLGWGYGAYTFVAIMIPVIGTKDFQGAGRYAMAAFPALAVGAQLLTDRPRLRTAWFVATSGLLLWFTAAFARGYYVA
ncbi:MAG: hypothetical protein KDB33_15345 [Acidimicrobiales bacterium]|nr:hypothetical protein [Acidimicrobiales bacterium]MCB1261742.1 hypothetical protein [Acidimicrobiales bacterium]